jgi:hypothetical protein
VILAEERIASNSSMHFQDRSADDEHLEAEEFRNVGRKATGI